MQKILNLKSLTGVVLGVLQLASFGFSATKVAGDLIAFNQIDEAGSVNCPLSVRAAIVKNPLYANVIVSEDVENQIGFADLLLADENFNSSSSIPQVTLSNEGIENHLDLIGGGPVDSKGNYQVAVIYGNKALYLNTVITDDVTPMSGNNGFSELNLSVNPASNSKARCIVKGQIVQSVPFAG